MNATRITEQPEETRGLEEKLCQAPGPVPNPRYMEDELALVEELLRTTCATEKPELKMSQADFFSPDENGDYGDDFFDPDLDDEYLYSLVQALSDTSDFQAGDLVSALRHKAARGCDRESRLCLAILRKARLSQASVPYLTVYLSTVIASFLADSGASYSILSTRSVSDMLGGSWSDSIVRDGGWLPKFELADGSHTSAIGKVMLDIGFTEKGKRVRQNFFVLKSETPIAILGVDFFMRSGAVLNFATSKMSFRKLQGVRQVPFQVRRATTLRGASCPVYLDEPLRLLPGQKARVLGVLGDGDPLSSCTATGTIEPVGKGHQAGHAIKFSVTRFDCTDRATVEIWNESAEPSILKAGSLIACLVPAPVVPDDKRFLSDSCEPLRMITDQIDMKGPGPFRTGYVEAPVASATAVDDPAPGFDEVKVSVALPTNCLLYTSPSPRDQRGSRMPSSA